MKRRMNTALALAAAGWIAVLGMGSALGEGSGAGSSSAGGEGGQVRAHPPATPEQQAALKQIKEVFEREYVQTKVEARGELARRLLAQAESTGGSTAVRYVLYSEAQRLASGVGDIDTALAAVAGMAGVWEVNENVLRVSIADATLPSAKGEAARTLAELYAEVTRTALEADDFAAAARYAVRASTAARNAADAGLAAAMNRRVQEVNRVQAEYNRLAAARKKLAEDPADKAANAQVGRYLCLIKQDWEAGLPLLAKGDDAALAALAAAEAGGAANDAAVVALGDKWWDWAEKQADAYVQRSARSRAGEHYEAVKDRLEGFDLKKVSMRLEKIAAENAVAGDVRNFDLLKLVKTDKHVTSGKWEVVKDEGLKGGRGATGQFALIAAPVSPKGDYELTVAFAGKACLEVVVNVPVGNTATSLILHPSRPRLQEVKRTSYVDREAAAMVPGVKAALEDGKPHTLVVRVLQRGGKAGIQAKLDGKVILTWQGDPADLGTYRGWTLKEPQAAGLGVYAGEATFTKFGLRMITGTGKVLKDEVFTERKAGDPIKLPPPKE